MTDVVEVRSSDIRPVPDPTVLTQEASTRLEVTLRNLITVEIAHQHELFGEKLVKIETQLRELKERTAEQKSDTKAALDAALAAQKEQVANQTISSEKSINKSETATIERIKAVETLLTASTNATDGKITDLKDRVIAIEAVRLGTSAGMTRAHDAQMDIRGLVAIAISALLLIVAVVSVLFAFYKP